MNRFLLSTVAGMLLLTLSSSAHAGGHGHSYSSSKSFGGSYRFSTASSYHLRYGTPFSHGYYFYGLNNHFWTSSGWSSRYGCNLYWYPGNSSWYYWSGALNGYYPIGYITIAPPVATVVPVVAAPGGPLSAASLPLP